MIISIGEMPCRMNIFTGLENKMEKLRFKQSRYWWIEKDLKWILDNASFIYIERDNYKPTIVTKEKMGYSESNCFEMKVDAGGINVSSHSVYREYKENFIEKKSNDVNLILIDFLMRQNELHCLNPKPSFINLFTKKYKIITVNK